MRTRSLPVVAGLLALASLAGIATTSRADQLYGITFSNQLITINPTTGAGTLVGNLDSQMFGYGLAVQNGKLYTYDQNAEVIRQLDPNTAHTLATISIGNTSGFVGEGDLAFRSDGTGFLSTAGSPGVSLFSFNISNNTSSKISAEQFLFDGLAFNSSDVLYGLSQAQSGDGTSKLYTLDQTTGAKTLVGALNVPSATNEILGGLTFDSGGTLYGELSDGSSTSTLVTIDPATGQATTIGNIAGFGNVSGIAFLPSAVTAAPEPSTLVLTGIGLVSLSLARRRRAA
jgi:hypothetical protein